jgi:hypothetical protein
MTTSISAGARPALLFAATLAFIGAVVALLIPDTSSLLSHGHPAAVGLPDNVSEEGSRWERTPGGRTPS